MRNGDDFFKPRYTRTFSAVAFVARASALPAGGMVPDQPATITAAHKLPLNQIKDFSWRIIKSVIDAYVCGSKLGAAGASQDGVID